MNHDDILSLRYTEPRILLDIMRTFIPYRDFDRRTKVSSTMIFSKLTAISFINGCSISRGIFVALKDVTVLQVFVKLIKLPLNDLLLTRKYWPRYCKIVRNYYIIIKKNWIELFFNSQSKYALSKFQAKKCESTKRYRPKKIQESVPSIDFKCTEYCKIAQL
jgi:hypothetical protein